MEHTAEQTYEQGYARWPHRLADGHSTTAADGWNQAKHDSFDDDKRYFNEAPQYRESEPRGEYDCFTVGVRHRYY